MFSLIEQILSRIINNINEQKLIISRLTNKIIELEKIIKSIDQKISFPDYKNICPRCKGNRSTTFRDYSGIQRHEPCPYCLGKGKV